MKKYLIILLLASVKLNAQTGEWVWLRGSNINDAGGHYGIKGITDPADDPSGLWQSVCWTDLNGNFWIFGGIRTEPGFGYTSDMWKYDPLINQWTWMHGDNTTNGLGNYGTKGAASLSNLPPARSYGSASWVDNQNNLWMYGGFRDQGNGGLDDLWKYNTNTNEWTWVNGSDSTNSLPVYGTQGVPDSLNTPGQRSETCASWSDSHGDLFFFGGEVDGNSQASDMWRYNITSNQWTWIKGPQTTSSHGFFGIKGIESPLNNPPARYAFAKWKDLNGNFWLFGGESNGDEFNDLWRYNPITNNWTWMNGDSVGLSAGLYGIECIPAIMNTPCSRSFTTSTWVDKRGNLWLYSGGSGFSTVSGTNDLWMYCISNNEWTWVKGDSIVDTPGNWGTMGISSPANTPDPRGCAASWSDINGDLYLFGGTGPGFIYPYNDMWKFVIDTACAACATITSTEIINDENIINIYPNPASEFISIKINDIEKTTVDIYDLNGRKIPIKTIPISENEYKIDLSKLPKSVYYLQWKSIFSTGVKKIIVN